MMRRNKGQVAILAGLGLVAAIMVGGAFYAGSIKDLLQFLVDNFWVLMLLVLGGGFTLVLVVDSFQKNPKWKRDLTGMGIVLGVFLGLVFLPTVTGYVTGYTADLTVSVRNPWPFGSPVIKSVDISNFDEVGPLSILPHFQTRTLSFQDHVNGHAVIKCDGEKVVEKSFTMIILEGTVAARTLKIYNLPAGSSCTANIDIETDQKTVNFEVP